MYEIPEGYKDRIRNRTTCHFSWCDRLKILIGHIPEVTVDIAVEHAPGKMQTDSRVILLLPNWYVRLFRRKQKGAVSDSAATG